MFSNIQTKIWRTLVLRWSSTILPRFSLLRQKILDITAQIRKVRLLPVEKKKADFLGTSGVDQPQGSEFPGLPYCLPSIPGGKHNHQ